jgi:hypothetical protein
MNKNRRPRSRGQALVEFSLVAPMFFLLLFALIEFGRYVYYGQVLNNAAREGARYAIVHGADSAGCSSGPPPSGTPCDLNGDNVRSAIRAYAIGVIDGGSLSIPNPTWMPNNARGSRVSVSLDYSYNTILPLVPLPPFTIHGESTLVINN